MNSLAIKLSVLVLLVVLGGLLYGGLLVDERASAALDPKRERMLSQFALFANTRPQVVFVGDSITEQGMWQELFPGLSIANRGMGSDTTQGLIDRMEGIVSLRPAKLFIQIGVNDLNLGMAPEVPIANYAELFDRIDLALPDTQVYLQSILPVNDDWALIDNTHVPTLNAALQAQATRRGYTYIDLHSVMADGAGKLRKDFTNDGIHLLGPAYRVWREEIAGYVYE